MHAFHQLYYHLIWSIHSREPTIDRSWRPQLLAILNEEVKKRGGWPIRHNAMPDHVHLLVRLPPTVPISKFLGEVKGATSFCVNRDIKPTFKLRWQEGYGALSIRKDEVERVSRYIDNQERHHSNEKSQGCWRRRRSRARIGLKAMEKPPEGGCLVGLAIPFPGRERPGWRKGRLSDLDRRE